MEALPASKCCVGSIIDFIDARLREDEHTAVITARDDDTEAAIARHDMAHMRREILAKRLIVTMAQLPPEPGRQDRLLRCVALCWADHADYRPEWIL